MLISIIIGITQKRTGYNWTEEKLVYKRIEWRKGRSTWIIQGVCLY